MRAVSPLLIQNARASAEFADMPGARLGFTRYLGVPICNPQGDAIGTLCFLDSRSDDVLGEEDIRFLSLLAMRVSAEVERERSVQARVEEVSRMAERLAEANARLEATVEQRRRFVAMILHDLRQPLTGLQTLLYLLQNDPDPVQQAAYGQGLQNRIQALSRLLDGLLQYSEIEAGCFRLRRESVPLTALIQECIEIAAPLAPNDAVQVACEVDSDLETVPTDRDKLTHILLNLLSNALKFTPQGSVRVRACRNGTERWLLEVADTGIGMNEAVQERAFEEFYRAEGDTGRSGHGLGLAIVRQLCLAMGAELSLESAPGAGTRYTILFPFNAEAWR